jgi:hypothetical protein
MEEECVSELAMDMPDRYIQRQIDFDGIMKLDSDKREVLITLINSNGSYRSETEYMLQNMGLIIDRREGTINEIIK